MSTDRAICSCRKTQHTPKLIVITGGPGAGKTALLEIARKNFCEHIAILPEAASILFSGGFRRYDSNFGMKATQRAIYHIQHELENLACEEKKAALLLCDRGTVDGLAYWPGSEEEFWHEVGTCKEREFSKYAVVIHLRTPGKHQGYNHINPVRLESPEAAAIIDGNIEKAWKGHPKLFFVDSENEFLSKVELAIELIRQELPDCCRHLPVS